MLGACKSGRMPSSDASDSDAGFATCRRATACMLHCPWKQCSHSSSGSEILKVVKAILPCAHGAGVAQCPVPLQACRVLTATSFAVLHQR